MTAGSTADGPMWLTVFQTPPLLALGNQSIRFSTTMAAGLIEHEDYRSVVYDMCLEALEDEKDPRVPAVFDELKAMLHVHRPPREYLDGRIDWVDG